MSQENARSEELTAGMRVRLRPGLRWSLRERRGKPYFVVEDPVTARYFRVGRKEWQFATSLDGEATLTESLSRARQLLGDLSVTQHEFLTFCRWLVSVQLAEVQSATRSGRSSSALPSPTGPLSGLSVNPFFVKVPLFNPDRILTSVLPWMKWSLGPGFFAVWVLLCLTGTYHVIVHWDRFVASTYRVFAPNNWLYLITVWVALKIVHELFHGLFCKKYGGTVSCAGVALILFSPVAFLDVTSCWRFRSKWRRILTSAAGMYAELAVAAAAAIVWSHCEPGTLSQICHNVVLAASVTTLLFNVNPLMRFDGYYILTDLLEIQNLYTSGRQYVRHLAARYFFGVRSALPPWPASDAWLIKAYGVASLFWRCSVFVSMGVVATTLFHGAGLVLSVIAAFKWLGLPCVRTVKLLIQGEGGWRPNRARFVAASAVLVLATTALLAMPWPGGTSAPGVVDYEPFETVRAPGPGFVREICVSPGQLVRKGQVLVRLRHDEIDSELDDVRLAIQQSLVRSRVLNRDDETAQYQLEAEIRQSLQERADQLQQQAAKMSVRSPIAGRVIGADLDAMEGQYFETGTPLLAIGNESRKHIQLSIHESDLKEFSRKMGSSPIVRVFGYSTLIRSGRLSKIDPRGSVALIHPALTAAAGGGLAVRRRLGADPTDSGNDEQFELLAPRFTGIVELPREHAEQLYAGQLATVRLSHSNRTVGAHVYRAIQNWLRKRLDARSWKKANRSTR